MENEVKEHPLSEEERQYKIRSLQASVAEWTERFVGATTAEFEKLSYDQMVRYKKLLDELKKQ